MGLQLEYAVDVQLIIRNFQRMNFDWTKAQNLRN